MERFAPRPSTGSRGSQIEIEWRLEANLLFKARLSVISDTLLTRLKRRCRHEIGKVVRPCLRAVIITVFSIFELYLFGVPEIKISRYERANPNGSNHLP